MLKNHLKTAIALALIFVMVFALTAPALAEENSDLAAAEEAVREAEENYNIAVEKYNNALSKVGDVGEIDVDALTAEREKLASEYRETVPTKLEQKLADAEKKFQEGRASWEDVERVQNDISEYKNEMAERKARMDEIDEILTIFTAREEMYRCELELDIAKYNLEKLQQALIIPQTGDSNAVYLAAGVMMILAGAGLAVSRKRS
jgi:LPXTG-motif cell wall-anchored protein